MIAVIARPAPTPAGCPSHRLEMGEASASEQFHAALHARMQAFGLRGGGTHTLRKYGVRVALADQIIIARAPEDQTRRRADDRMILQLGRWAPNEGDSAALRAGEKDPYNLLKSFMDK